MPAHDLKALRLLFTLLEEHFDATTGYEDGWDDASIAATCGVREGYVSRVRSAAFGVVPLNRRDCPKPVTDNALPTLNLRELERAAIKAAMSAAGSFQRAAPILGISRHALSRRVRRHGMTLTALTKGSTCRDNGADSVRAVLQGGGRLRSAEVSEALGWGGAKTRSVLSYLKSRGEIMHDGTHYQIVSR